MKLDEIIKKVNAMPFMEYDITMCNNIDCYRKDNCHRYVMYQKLKADTRKYKPLLVNLYKGDYENCTLFWKHKK